MRVSLKAKACSQQVLGTLQYKDFLNISSMIEAVFHRVWDLLLVCNDALVHLSVGSIFTAIVLECDYFFGHQTLYHKSQHDNWMSSEFLCDITHYNILFAFSQCIHLLVLCLKPKNILIPIFWLSITFCTHINRDS